MSGENINRENGGSSGEIPGAEWAAAVFGLLLVVVALGYLAVMTARFDDTPPMIQLHVDTIVPGAEGFVITARAQNRGGQTASNASIEAVLEDERGGVVERRVATLDYLPAGSIRGLGFFFKNDPRALKLKLRPLAYELP